MDIIENTLKKFDDKTGSLTHESMKAFDEMFKIVDETIEREYLHLLKSTGLAPIVNEIVVNTLDELNSNGHIEKYGSEIKDMVNEGIVFDLLRRNKSIVYYYGTECFDAQKQLFANLYDESIIGLDE